MLTFIPKNKLAINICWSSALIWLLCMTNTQASPMESVDNARLDVTPKRCIALRKGQICYLEVTFHWQHPKMGDYCLLNVTNNKTVKCWQQTKNGQFSFDFQSTMSNDFSLRSQKSGKVHANAHIAVAWVYKSSKRAKSTWRIF